MLQPMANLPEGVLGFEATGKVEASDYGDVLMPAVREVWERGDEVRVFLVFERWDGMSPGVGRPQGRDEGTSRSGGGSRSSPTSTG